MAQGGDGRTYVRTDRKSPHSTGLRPLSGLLPKKYDLSLVTHPLFGWALSPIITTLQDKRTLFKDKNDFNKFFRVKLRAGGQYSSHMT